MYSDLYYLNNRFHTSTIERFHSILEANIELLGEVNFNYTFDHNHLLDIASYTCIIGYQTGGMMVPLLMASSTKATLSTVREHILFSNPTVCQ